MASNVVKCQLLVESHVRSEEPQVISLNSIKVMPVEARKQWIEAILKAQRIREAQQCQGHDSFQEYLLRVDGTIGISTSTDPNAGNSTVEYQPLPKVIDAFTIGAGTEAEDSAPKSTSWDHSRHSSASENLPALHDVNLKDNMAGFGTTLGNVIYGCFKALVKAQRSTRQIGQALLKSMTDISNWIRANPRQAAFILGGIILLVLVCATPAILAAAGFSAIGPVAGSAAAAWQASIGSVAAGSLFAFLQSAAMGGAALGVITGVGVVGGGLAVAVGVASSKKSELAKGVGEVAHKAKEFVEKEIVGGLFKKVQGCFGKKD